MADGTKLYISKKKSLKKYFFSSVFTKQTEKRRICILVMVNIQSNRPDVLTLTPFTPTFEED